MDARLQGRRALITGAGAGMGLATARRFAAEGMAALAVVDRVADRLDSLRAELEPYGTTVVAIEADLSDPDNVTTCGTEAIRQLGGVDVLVSNAGMSALESFLDTNLETLQRILNVNLIAGYLLGQLVARDLIERNAPGSLLYTAATCDKGGVPEVPAYSASKAALINLVRCVAPVLGPYGIRVNSVSPGFTDTSMAEDMSGAVEGLAADFDRVVSAQIPLRRQATPEDIAAAFTFLASDDGAYITGADLRVDGGISAPNHTLRWWDEPKS